jgi:hypothetical protein
MAMVALPELEPGVEVEVRTHFTARWSGGFEVDRVVGDRVRIRRRSDGVVLPVALEVDDVRLQAAPRGRVRLDATAGVERAT